MKLLLSISKRILENIEVNEIFELIEKYDINKNISGLEIMTDNYEYLKKYSQKCKERDLIFQCHSPKTLQESDIYNYLNDVSKLSKSIDKKINIVFHSLELSNINESINETNLYMKNILKFKNDNNLNLSISIENLNYHNGIKRINVENIDKILSIHKNLCYTYDIGHDIFDNKIVTEITEIQKQRINNIHIHCYINDEDHHPILNDTNNIEVIKNSIEMLKKIRYDKNIVLEYGIDFMTGDTYESKMIDYIKSFQIVQEII